MLKVVSPPLFHTHTSYCLCIKHRTHLKSCSECQAHCWCNRGIHQSVITERANVVEDINYLELRRTSPRFCLLFHACPVTLLTAHSKGQGDILLTKQRNTNWKIFCLRHFYFFLNKTAHCPFSSLQLRFQHQHKFVSLVFVNDAFLANITAERSIHGNLIYSLRT